MLYCKESYEKIKTDIRSVVKYKSFKRELICLAVSDWIRGGIAVLARNIVHKILFTPPHWLLYKILDIVVFFGTKYRQ